MTNDFMRNWKFSRYDKPDDVRTVHLPHDAMILEPRCRCLNASKSGYFPGGRYLYEKDFEITPDQIGQYIAVVFEGVYRCATVYVNGKKANILGKICMDQCIVDLTDIKDVSMDSEVIFYGNGGPNLLDVANLADTNRNELLSIVSRRVARVYIKDKKIYKILDYLS